MSAGNTLGWSLVSSGIVTLILAALPGPDLLWGLALIVAGVVLLLRRV